MAVAWDRSDLERLLREASEDRVRLLIDERSLQTAFAAGDVEAHGMREAAVALTIAIAAGTGAAGAKGAVDASGGAPVRSATDAYTAIENVRADVGAPEPSSGGEGATISAPIPAQAAGLAGALALSIAGAAFAFRRRRAGLA